VVPHHGTLLKVARDGSTTEILATGFRAANGVCVEPDGTFYVWGNVSQLPAPLSDGMGFFQAALERKVIVVPGEFFDINPGKRRANRGSRFRHYVRFSFGPSMQTMETALSRLEALVTPLLSG
jgi:aspartate/methionine/tyrosine aminotransferase